MKTRFKVVFVVLACLQAGFSFASDFYYWTASSNGHGTRYESPTALCQSRADGYDYFKILRLANNSPTQISCVYEYTFIGGTSINQGVIHTYRHGTSCPSGTDYNPSTGECIIPDEPVCESGNRLASIGYDVSGGSSAYVCHNECTYSPTGVFNDWANDTTISGFVSTGHTCKETETENQLIGWVEEDIFVGKCFTAGQLTICPDDNLPEPDPDLPLPPDLEPPNCVNVNGQNQCYEQGSNCGQVNGAWTCIPDQPDQTPNCTYVNGQNVCIDPNDKKPIPESDPDHPVNGGNGDGDNTNDPKDPRPPESGGDPDGGTQGQGANELATNKAVSDASLSMQAALWGSSEAHLKGMKEALLETLPAEHPEKDNDHILTESMTLYEQSMADAVSDEVVGEIVAGSDDNIDIFEVLQPSSCQNFSWTIPGQSESFEFGCESSNIFKDIFGWILYILTALYIFDTAVRARAQ